VIATDHDEFDAMAVGWALHALEPAEEQAFVEHVATCDRCQRLVRDSEGVLGELAYDVPLVDPPSHLLDLIRDGIGATAATTGDSLRVDHGVAPLVPLPRRTAGRPPREVVGFRLRWAIPALAAGLVLFALLGWSLVLQSRVDEAERIAAQRQEVITELARGSSGTILTDPSNRTVGYVVRRGSTVEIVTGGLAPNDRARSTYVLWAVGGSGQPRAVGTFDVDALSVDVRLVSGSAPPSDSVSGFAISRELGRTAPQRPSHILANGAVSR